MKNEHIRIIEKEVIHIKEDNVIRVEKKYLLDDITALRLRSRLQAVVPPDPMGSAAGYMVRSLYFDTLYDNDYYDKQNGLEYRQKIRLRIYSANDRTAKLELKEKRGQSQWKRSLTISAEDAGRLIQMDYGVLATIDTPFAQEMFRIMQTGLYVPKTIVQFWRAAYAIGTNNTRITLDTKLMATESCFDLFSDKLSFYPILLQPILEVKYNHFLLGYLKQLLSGIDQPELSMSKYCLARQISFY